MVAASKATGSGHLIWPKGCTIEDVSMEFVSVLNHALTILSWQENLPSDEMPPYWKWHLDWEIDEWFDDVKRKREQKMGISNSIEDDDDWEENELYKEWEEELRK